MKEFPNGEVEIVSASLVSSVQYVCVCRLHVDEELQPVFLEQSLSVKTQPTTLSISGGSGGGGGGGGRVFSQLLALIT